MIRAVALFTFGLILVGTCAFSARQHGRILVVKHNCYHTIATACVEAALMLAAVWG